MIDAVAARCEGQNGRAGKGVQELEGLVGLREEERASAVDRAQRHPHNPPGRAMQELLHHKTKANAKAPMQCGAIGPVRFMRLLGGCPRLLNKREYDTEQGLSITKGR